MRVKEIKIIPTENWWKMNIVYEDPYTNFGCERPNLSEIIEELEYRVNDSVGENKK